MRRIIGSMLGGAVLVASVFGILSGTAFATASCPGSFVGTVTHGPDEGLVVAGSITVSIDNAGVVTGELHRSTGSTVAISGRVEGNSLHVTFDLGNASLRGVGSLVGANFVTCMGTTGGVFKGPAASDHGNWGIIWGS
ncbi:MAG: hypothetical protein ACHQIG_10780 [Acidimicrobiia bacterium]